MALLPVIFYKDANLKVRISPHAVMRHCPQCPHLQTTVHWCVCVCACACMYVCEHHLLHIRRQNQIKKHVTGRGGRREEKIKYCREANTMKKPSRKARTGSRANSLSCLLLSFWHGAGQGGEEKELHVLGATV